MDLNISVKFAELHGDKYIRLIDLVHGLRKAALDADSESGRQFFLQVVKLLEGFEIDEQKPRSGN